MPGCVRFARSFLPVMLLPALSACSYLEGLDLGAWRGGWGEAEPVVASGPDPDAPREPALPTRHFDAIGAEQEVLGDVQILFAHHENTFVQIARDFDLGYEELKLANPGVDAWIPGEGTPIYLPTMNVVPALPREGIVLNLPSMRLMYFVDDDASDARRVTSHPIGIGREGWATPTGSDAKRLSNLSKGRQSND